MNYPILTDAPSAPRSLNATDLTPTSVTLNWSAPLSNGGSPIVGYMVETKDKFSTRWTNVSEHMVTKLTMSVPNLKEKNEYQFRVVAHNKAGPGQPSEPINVTAKYPFSKFIMFSLKYICTQKICF